MSMSSNRGDQSQTVMIVNMIEADEIYAGKWMREYFIIQDLPKPLGCNGLEKSRCEERKSTVYLYCQVVCQLAVIELTRGEKSKLRF
jgi:hypothetical protein